MNNVMTGNYINGDKIHNFEFYTSLSASNKVKFVNSVTSILVDGENYNSIIYDIIFDFYVVDIFATDESTKEVVDRLKHSNAFLEDVEEFLENTNIAEIIKAGADYGLIDELKHSVDLNVQYLTGIHPNRLNDALTELINTIERKIDGVDLSAMMDVAQLFAGMTDDFTTENVVNAYINSDMHKDNLNEIKKSKKKKK